MLNDVATVAWKELRELTTDPWRWGSGVATFALALLVFGVIAPWQVGRAWVESPLILMSWAWVPLLMVSSMVVDMVVGERERHTLETLLASRLSESAILTGKLVIVVGYATTITGGSLCLGLVTVNLLHAGEGLVWYPGPTLVGTGTVTLLGSLGVSGLGVLVSLRASTVRQATQAMSIAVLLIALVPIVVARSMLWSRLIPGESLAAQAAVVTVVGLGGLIVAVVAVLILAYSRFHRSAIILD